MQKAELRTLHMQEVVNRPVQPKAPPNDPKREGNIWQRYEQLETTSVELAKVNQQIVDERNKYRKACASQCYVCACACRTCRQHTQGVSLQRLHTGLNSALLELDVSNSWGGWQMAVALLHNITVLTLIGFSLQLSCLQERRRLEDALLELEASNRAMAAQLPAGAAKRPQSPHVAEVLSTLGQDGELQASVALKLQYLPRRSSETARRQAWPLAL